MNLQDCCGASRQDFFKRIGAVGTGSLFGSAGLIAHGGGHAAPAKRGRIDVHHHMLPEFCFPNNRWQPEASIETIDKFGTALANRFVRYSRPLQRRCFTAATGDAGLEISRARLTDSAPELWNSVYTV